MASKIVGALVIAILLILSPKGFGQSLDLRGVEIELFFQNAGMLPFQAQAFRQDAWLESRYDRCVVAKSGSRYLFQWTGERRYRLAEFAQMSDCPPLRTQLSFALHEIRTERLYACFWRARDYRSALAALRRGFGRGHC